MIFSRCGYHLVDFVPLKQLQAYLLQFSFTFFLLEFIFLVVSFNSITIVIGVKIQILYQILIKPPNQFYPIIIWADTYLQIITSSI